MVEKVLVTGISGFLAKHVALKFLSAGHMVCGTLRNLDRAEEVRRALRPHLPPEALLRLCFVQTDLLSDEAWAAAMPNITAVLHVAAPFTIEQPLDVDTLLRPAVEGTLRVLRMAKAAGVRRVVMTSSIASIVDVTRVAQMDERDWVDPDAPGILNTTRVRVLAERAAWEFAAQNEIDLTVINPGLIFGPPMDKHYGASVGVIRRMLHGHDPVVPMIGTASADVRDVAEMHLRAVQRPVSIGKRYIGVAGTMTLPQIARLLKLTYPRRRIATVVAPRWLLRLYRLWDPAVAAILPILGHVPQLSNLQARQDLGMEFMPPAEAVKATADWLIKAGEV